MRVFLLLICSCLVSCMLSHEQSHIASYESSETDSFYSCPEEEVKVTAKAIYGKDDRKDWFESPDGIKTQWARATMALIHVSKIKDIGNGFYRISSETHGEKNDLCPEVPFIDQPTPVRCSGFLVFYNDMALTAGHCQKNTWECKNTYFVFDFAKQWENQSEYDIPASNVYKCKEIIAHEKTYQGDFALVRLDRQVKDRSPLEFRRHGTVSLGEKLTLIGHPAGLPSKIAEGFVKEVNPPYEFYASVDASMGNSGSAVINNKTGLLEGLLVSGVKDYKSKGSCQVEYPCEPDGDDCIGELVTPISRVLAKIPQLCLL